MLNFSIMLRLGFDLISLAALVRAGPEVVAFRSDVPGAWFS